MTSRPSRVTVRFYLPLLACVLAFPLFAYLGAAAPAPLAGVKDRDTDDTPVVPDIEVRLTDGGTMKLKFLDEDVPLKTPYGKLVIPADKVHEIECATRLPVATDRKIKAAIKRLDSEEHKDREAARNELIKFGIKAYAALLAAEKSDAAQVRRLAKPLAEAIRESASEEELEVRPNDVVTTADSRIAGRIERESFRVSTPQFGEVRLKLSDVRATRSLKLVKEEKKEDALPNPGNMGTYANMVGKTLSFTVVGTNVGHAYGTNTYTTDSVLAFAAVHAGVLKVGQTGVVKVKVLGQVAGFTGSLQNGLQSANYNGPYPGFEIIKKKR